MYEETIAGLRKIVQDYKGRLTPYMRVTICKAADAIEELQNLTDAQLDIIKQYQVYLTKQHWISVTERLPERGSVVLAYSSELFTVIAYYNYDKEWDIPNPHITHWMPLPEPPKEET